MRLLPSSAKTLVTLLAFGFSFIVLVFAMPAFAQLTAPAGPAPSRSTPSTTTVPNVITLDDAIQEALVRNYTIVTTANSQRRNEIEVSRSEDNLLPSAQASGSYNYTYSLQPVGDRTTTIYDPLTGLPVQTVTTAAGSSSLSYSGTADFNIFNGGADAARIRAAHASLNSATGTLEWTRQQIAFNVTSDYLNALRNNELVDAARKSLDEANAQLTLVRGEYDAGTVPIGQVYQQQAVVGQDQLLLIQAENNYENAKAALLFQLNVPPNQYNNYGFTVAGIDTSTSVATRAAIDTNITDARIDSVINSRPDIIAQQYNVESLIDQVAITRGALLPSLNASAGIEGSGVDPNAFKIQMDNRLVAGLSLTIPLFDRMQNRLLIQEQEVDIETQRINLQQDVQQIRSDAAVAVNNMRSADLALDASDISLTAAEESLRLATERLRVGAGTQVDVIIAEAAVETARTNRVNAKYNFVQAQRQLQYTLGEWHY
jgi:outer membrane protein